MAHIKIFQIKAEIQIICNGCGPQWNITHMWMKAAEREDFQGKQHKEGVTVA